MMKFRINKTAAAIGWMTILAVLFAVFWRSGLSITDLSETIKLEMDQLGAWGPVVYVAAYSLRSLIFFPASVLTALGGMLFGPWLGIILTIIGENISANLSFTVGRYFGGGMLTGIMAKSGFITRLACGVQQNGFMAVISMRLMYLPFDLVGYACGVCDIRRRDFALGTVLGTIPGLATFVFVGSAVANYNYAMVAVAAAVSSLILARYVKNRQAQKQLSNI